ncbi:hypothetical protein PHAVU_007G072200 [Phaseolus vulgaris]|uniref:Uncharacterized protein n=1 Tax=Phaseolus vulgaris TaxID=3885 RepID=V7BC66_PHAVU|nr:hypothetical protein PHAVU_007G072200g [Phaseolus vulgaris]ESW15429.1 hypothetical protein PHAVU_007G072200g [Phaseolus vulgaris]
MEQLSQPPLRPKFNNPHPHSCHPHHSDRVTYFEEVLKEKEEDGLEGKDVEFFKERVERLESEREERNGVMFKVLESLTSTKYSLSRVIEGLEGEKNETSVEDCEGDCSGVESRMLLEESRLVSRLVIEVEKRVDRYKEMMRKEKKELESSLISLTEENRDVNNLLRIALLEKEALEKRIKGHDHKRMPLLQLGWFMMGGGSNEQSTECSGAKSDSSECEEEVVSVASTVERMMKNLRLEITQLRRSLEESRSDTERLQSLTEKQAKEIVENKHYIKDLEDRERILAQNVEEFLMEMKAAEEEVARWKEACELEVEAGKVAALKQELHKTKIALNISNGKLRLKEELAITAIAAQEAAERSLKLADTRAVELRRRVEELTRQLEEAEKRESNIHKVRRICWPWQIFKLTSANVANTRVGNAKRMLPEMQALI